MVGKLVPVLFLFFCLSSYAQFQFSGEVTLQGLYTTGEDLPFWLHKNQRGRISKNTDTAGWVSGRFLHEVGTNATLEIGAGFLYQDGLSDHVFLDESYVQLLNTWLEAVVGRKQMAARYNGLSATNENMLWSLNARPLPGLQLRTRKPILLFPSAGLGLELSLSEYALERFRHVSYARLHHKSLHLVYQPNEAWSLRGGVQHFVQWGGISQSQGIQPEGITDYLLVLTGSKGGENALTTDQLNKLGNHLGSYELTVKRNFKGMALELIYNHIFEDGSGLRFANFPDGRYGLLFDFKEEGNFINKVLYEFYYTRNQGINSSSPHKNDNYLNNGVYRNGWTYEQRIVGLPFFSFDTESNRVTNNKFVMHHLGISGSFSKSARGLPYKLLVSAGRSEGSHGRQFTPVEEVAYLSFELLLLQNFMDLRLQLGAEYNSQYAPVYGAGLQLTKRF